MGDRGVERLRLLIMRHPHDIVPRDEKDEVLRAIYDELVGLRADLRAGAESPVRKPAAKPEKAKPAAKPVAKPTAKPKLRTRTKKAT